MIKDYFLVSCVRLFFYLFPLFSSPLSLFKHAIRTSQMIWLSDKCHLVYSTYSFRPSAPFRFFSELMESEVDTNICGVFYVRWGWRVYRIWKKYCHSQRKGNIFLHTHTNTLYKNDIFFSEGERSDRIWLWKSLKAFEQHLTVFVFYLFFFALLLLHVFPQQSMRREVALFCAYNNGLVEKCYCHSGGQSAEREKWNQAGSIVLGYSGLWRLWKYIRYVTLAFTFSPETYKYIHHLFSRFIFTKEK